MRLRARLLLAFLLSSCGGVPPGPAVAPAPSAPPSCEGPLRAALAEIASLREQGRLDRASSRAKAAEPLCPALVSEVHEVRLDLLHELGDDEGALGIARDLDAAGGMSAGLAAKVHEVIAHPPRPRTRADLRRADELRAAGDLAGARAAYDEAVRAHPRDPLALAALADVELARSNGAAARALFDRALHAATDPARVVTFEGDMEEGPVLVGIARPDATQIGVLRRAVATGEGFRSTIVGHDVTIGSSHTATFGAGRPLVVVSPDGRDALKIDLGDVTEAVFLPGEKELLALGKSQIHRVDLATGAILGRHAATGPSLRLAGPARFAVGTDVFRFPELTPVFTVPAGATLSPRVVAYMEPRETPKGHRTWIVVKRIEDGAPVFERDVAGEDFEQTLEIHPSGRYVAWLGEVFAQQINTGSILDVETKKITSFPYLGINKMSATAMRITADGKETCVFDLGWSPSRVARGQARGSETRCWIRGGEAVVVDVPRTPHFEPVLASISAGSLSPDGKLASFAELGERTGGKATVAVRVIDVATGSDVKRFELGTTERYGPDAVMVTGSVVRVESGEAFDGCYDARAGARLPCPADAHDPDLGVLPPSGTTFLKHESARVLAKGGFLELQLGKSKTCWTPELREVPAESCESKKPNDVIVKAGLARVPGVSEPIRLSLPLKEAHGYVAKVGGADVLVLPHEWMAHYFTMKGELTGTVTGVGPKRLVGILPDGSFDLAGEGNEGRERLACVAGDLFLSFEACAELRLAPRALVERLGGAAASK